MGPQSHDNQDDLRSIAGERLIYAAEKFDPLRGYDGQFGQFALQLMVQGMYKWFRDQPHIRRNRTEYTEPWIFEDVEETELPDETFPAPDEEVYATSLAELMLNAVADLTPRHAAVVRMRFGLQGDAPMTLPEIAAILPREDGGTGPLTKQTVQSMLEAAFTHIRRGPYGRLLRGYLE